MEAKEPTELPPWRRKPTFVWSSPDGVATSQLLAQLQAWYDEGARPSVSESFRQVWFLQFVDVSGKIQQFLTEPGLSDAELLELNSAKLDQAEKKATLGFMDAMKYVETLLTKQQEMVLSLDCVLQIHRMVVSGDAAAGLRDEEARASLSAHLDELNSSLVSLKQRLPRLSDQALPMIKLAACTLLWFNSHRPFGDGNARVAELLLAALLDKLVPCFPLMLNVNGAVEKGMMSSLEGGRIKTTGSTAVLFMYMQGKPPPPSGVEDVTAYIIEKVWKFWKAAFLPGR